MLPMGVVIPWRTWEIREKMTTDVSHFFIFFPLQSGNDHTKVSQSRIKFYHCPLFLVFFFWGACFLFRKLQQLSLVLRPVLTTSYGDTMWWLCRFDSLNLLNYPEPFFSTFFLIISWRFQEATSFDRSKDRPNYPRSFTCDFFAVHFTWFWKPSSSYAMLLRADISGPLADFCCSESQTSRRNRAIYIYNYINYRLYE